MNKTYSTNDFYEIAVLKLAGFPPEKVEVYYDRAGRPSGSSFYADKAKLPKRENMKVVWTNADGTEKSVPLLSFLTGEQSYADIFIRTKREIFEIVDRKGKANGNNSENETR